jgi:phosphoglycerol transferase MdoB-like AlkP superfamily enzyme
MQYLILPKRILDMFVRFGRLAIPLFVLAHALLTWALFRLVLLLASVSNIEFSPQMAKMVPYSVRFDVIIFSYFWGLFLFLYILTPGHWLERSHRYVWKPIFTILVGFIVALEMATFPFLFEYGNRLDRLAVEYLIYPQEVFSMMSKGYKTEIVLAVVVTGLFVKVFVSSFDYIAAQINSESLSTSIPRTVITALIVALLIFLGARSSVGHRPANISSASFSNQHLVNELTLNSAYTLFYSLYRMKDESNPFDIYPSMHRDTVFSTVKTFSGSDGKTFLDGSETIVNRAKVTEGTSQPKYNLVIVLEESLGSDFVGRQGGTDTSPEIDRISQDGIFFDQLYATGTRTVRGIEATISGFPPTPGRSVVKLGGGKKDFWTMGTYLKQFGYTNMFFYGGDTNFDDMKAFFRGNDFDEIEDLTTITGDYEEGSWGIHDEDVFAIAHEALEEKSKNDEPFFAVILSTSNHSPFDYPEEKIELHPDFPKESHENAIKYSDYALGTFYDAAKNGSYSDNTIFLFVADHNTRVKGHDLIPVHKFRIPGMLIGPNIPKMTYETVCSNIDLLPTILHYMDLDGPTPLLGNDLMNLPDDYPGRAIMQYGTTFGFRIGNEVAILRPNMETKDFVYQENTLEPSITDEQLNETALAHALLPWILYSDKMYNVDENTYTSMN